MGSIKSTVGRSCIKFWAIHLDNDKLGEQSVDMLLFAQIFKVHGEAFLERTALVFLVFLDF